MNQVLTLCLRNENWNYVTLLDVDWQQNVSDILNVTVLWADHEAL
jgi:hypothetical protein